MHLRHAAGRFRPDRIRHRDERPDVVAGAADDHGLVGALHLRELRFEPVERGLFPGEPHAPDPEPLAADHGLGATPRDGPEVGELGRFDATPARVADDGARQRMLAAQLDGQQAGQHLVLRAAVHRPQLADVRIAARDDPRLVERHRAQPSQLLQMRAALDQHAVPRGRRDGGGDRHRRRDHQPARAGDQQDEHRLVEPVLPAAAEQQRRHGPDRERHREHQRRVVPRELVDEALGRRPVVVALADHAGDTGQHRVRGGPRGAQLDHAVTVDRPREHRVAGRLPGGHRFPGDQRLIHVGIAVGHHAVARDALSRPHAHVRADRDAVHRGPVLMVAVHHRRRGRGDAQQRADRVARPPRAPVFQQPGEPVEESQRRRFGPFRQEQGADDRHQHQRVHVRPQVGQGCHRLGRGVEQPGDDAEEQQQDDGSVDAVRPVRVGQQRLRHAAARHHDVQDQAAAQGESARRHQRVAAVRLPPRLDPRRRVPRFGAHPEAGDRRGDLVAAEGVRLRIDGHAAVDDMEGDPVDALAASERVAQQRGLLVAVQALDPIIQLFADGVLLVLYRRHCNDALNDARPSTDASPVGPFRFPSIQGRVDDRVSAGSMTAWRRLHEQGGSP